VTVQAVDGTLEGAVEARRLSFLIPMLAPPTSVTLNGSALDQDAVEGAFWEWDEDLRTVYIDIGLVAANESTDLRISR